MKRKRKHGHSKGPWKFEQHDGNYEIWNSNTKIAIINQAHEHPDGAQDLSNADLIASAPDMLKVIEDIRILLLAQMHDEREINPYFLLHRLDLIISRARGER